MPKFFLCAALLAMLPCGVAFAGDVPVTESNAHFDKDTVKLKAGDALLVTNSDTGDHNLSLVDDEGDAQDLGVQKPGRVLRVKFDSAGSFKLRCNITPDMRLRVIVD